MMSPSQGIGPGVEPMRREQCMGGVFLTGCFLLATSPVIAASVKEGSSIRNLAAEPPVQIAAQSTRKLLEQKARLLESYLAAPSATALAERGGEEAKMLIQEAKRLLEDSQAALQADDLATASELLNDGLRSLSAASSLAAKQKPPPNAGEEAAHYDRLKRQTEGYLNSIQEELSLRRSASEFATPVAQIEAGLSKAANLAVAKRYGDANAVLAESYKQSVTLVSQLRQGETVVSSLDFATPEEELAYERDRHESYRLLVAIMLNDKDRTSPELTELTDRYLQRSAQIREQAEALALAGDAVAAIGTMEQATGWLVRALRSGGFYVPE